MLHSSLFKIAPYLHNALRRSSLECKIVFQGDNADVSSGRDAIFDILMDCCATVSFWCSQCRDAAS